MPAFGSRRPGHFVCRRRRVRVFDDVRVCQALGDLPAFQKGVLPEFHRAAVHTGDDAAGENSVSAGKGEYPRALFGRCFCGTVGLLCNFYAIGQLNLSDAYMLNKLSPFFAILFSVFFAEGEAELGAGAGRAGGLCGQRVHHPAELPQPSGTFPAFAGSNRRHGRGRGLCACAQAGRASRRTSEQRIVFCFFCVFPVWSPAVLIFSFRPHDRFPAHLPDSRRHVRLRGAAGHHQSLPLRACQGISVYDYTQVIFAAALGFPSSLGTCRMRSACWAMCSSAARVWGCILQ